jgi:hypothetical protein
LYGKLVGEFYPPPSLDSAKRVTLAFVTLAATFDRSMGWCQWSASCFSRRESSAGNLAFARPKTYNLKAESVSSGVRWYT